MPREYIQSCRLNYQRNSENYKLSDQIIWLVPPSPRNFFYNLKNTYGVGMELCLSEPNLVANILKSKWPHHMVQFTDRILQGKIKTMLHFGIQRWYQLEIFTSKSPWQKNLTDDVIFRILLTSAKMYFDL